MRILANLHVDARLRLVAGVNLVHLARHKIGDGRDELHVDARRRLCDWLPADGRRCGRRDEELLGEFRYVQVSGICAQLLLELTRRSSNELGARAPEDGLAELALRQLLESQLSRLVAAEVHSDSAKAFQVDERHARIEGQKERLKLVLHLGVHEDVRIHIGDYDNIAGRILMLLLLLLRLVNIIVIAGVCYHGFLDDAAAIHGMMMIIICDIRCLIREWILLEIHIHAFHLIGDVLN